MDWQDDDRDPWSLTTRETMPASPGAALLDIEIIEGVKPLDEQFAVHPPKTVPDALYGPLFGQQSPSPRGALDSVDRGNAGPLQTYAILDAARVANLPMVLEASGLEHRCLFKGAAYDELKDLAPWIVRLEDGNKFTRQLFTRGQSFWSLWDKEPGIYIRSRASCDDLWRHFRKFTRVRDRKGRWYYIQYWRPAFFLDYILSMAPEKQRIFIGECEAFIVVRRKLTHRVARNQSSSSSSVVSVMGKSGEL